MIKAVVYTSNTGFSETYAKMLSQRLSLPCYPLSESKKHLRKKDCIIYFGWLFAGSIKGYKKAAQLYNINCVCAVGLCDTGTLLDETRKRNSIPESTPLFTLQGGIKKGELRGINKFMINMLAKGLSKQKSPTREELRMLELLSHDASYVKEENLLPVIEKIPLHGE